MLNLFEKISEQKVQYSLGCQCFIPTDIKVCKPFLKNRNDFSIKRKVYVYYIFLKTNLNII